MTDSFHLDYETARADVSSELQALRRRRDAALLWEERARIQALIDPLQVKYDALVRSRYAPAGMPLKERES